MRSLRERSWNEDRGDLRGSPGSMRLLAEGVRREAHEENWEEKAEG